MNAVAAGLPASEAARIRDAAADAFTSALGIGFTVAAACALLAAVGAKLWLPATHRGRAVDGVVTRAGVVSRAGVVKPQAAALATAA